MTTTTAAGADVRARLTAHDFLALDDSLSDTERLIRDTVRAFVRRDILPRLPEAYAQGYLPTVADTNWEIVAVADLNGDRKADVLWRLVHPYVIHREVEAVIPDRGPKPQRHLAGSDLARQVKLRPRPRHVGLPAHRPQLAPVLSAVTGHLHIEHRPIPRAGPPPERHLRI